MVTTTTDRAEVFSRPAARFDDDGNLEVRASASLAAAAPSGTRRRDTSRRIPPATTR